MMFQMVRGVVMNIVNRLGIHVVSRHAVMVVVVVGRSSLSNIGSYNLCSDCVPVNHARHTNASSDCLHGKQSNQQPNQQKP